MEDIELIKSICKYLTKKDQCCNGKNFAAKCNENNCPIINIIKNGKKQRN